MPRFAALVLLAIVTAGCGRSAPTAAPGDPQLRKLQEDAEHFKMESGASAPPGELPLKYTDPNGKEVDLATYRGQKNVVLVVVRGVPKDNPYPGVSACPGCIAQVNAMAANYTKFQERNAEVVVVYPGPKDTLPKFLADAKVNGIDDNPRVPFPLVSDSDLRAVKTLGIDGDWARPSTYILDKQGNVVFAYVSPKGSHYDRPSLKAVFEQLDKLNANK